MMRRVYGPLCTEFYDLDKPEPEPRALAWYLARARRAAGPVLEPMCGSGRFLLPLLAAGVAIEGADASASMLAACRRHAAARGLAPVLHAGALETLALGRRFALAIVPAGSIGLVARGAALEAALARLLAHLVPGGGLVVEIDEPGTGPVPPRPERVVRAADGTTIHYHCVAGAEAGGCRVRYRSRYERRRGATVLASEAEELVVEHHARDAFARLAQEAGFAEVRAVDEPWRDAGSVLLECRAPAGP